METFNFFDWYVIDFGHFVVKLGMLKIWLSSRLEDCDGRRRQCWMREFVGRRLPVMISMFRGPIRLPAGLYFDLP